MTSLPLTAVPGRLGQDRIAEGDEAADHADALLVQLLDGRPEVVDVANGADLPPERHGRVPADDAGLVLEIELDRVDLLLLDQVEHAAAQLVVRPGIGAHVHGAHRLRRLARHERDGDGAERRVPGRVGGVELERGRRRRLEIEREAAVLQLERTAVDGDGRSRLGDAPGVGRGS